MVYVKVVFLVFLVFLVVWRCKVFGVGILVWLRGFWLMEWVCFGVVNGCIYSKMWMILIIKSIK